MLFMLLALPFKTASTQTSKSGTPPVQTRQQHSGRLSIDDRVRLMTKSLELNEHQQAAVKNILLQRQQQTIQLRQDPSLPGSERIERLRSLQVITVERIRAVLNDEQKKKYDPLAAQRIKSTPKRSVEDWLQAATPK
jgi:Spy/CpxP family protein refolding chaperone